MGDFSSGVDEIIKAPGGYLDVAEMVDNDPLLRLDRRIAKQYKEIVTKSRFKSPNQ